MALDRQSIEKKDFPVGRRGYDPTAVDAHLSAVAAEVEELRQSARRRSETLATAASEQVRAIVEAAESSADEITREAENEAREIREEAGNEARATRERAAEQARQFVDKVSESTNAMLQRIDAMEAEFGRMIESLREGGNRLTADLQLLEGDLSTASESLAFRPNFEAEAEGGGFGGLGARSGEEAELHGVAGDSASTETFRASEAGVSTGQGGDDDLYVPPGSDPSDYDYSAPSSGSGWGSGEGSEAAPGASGGGSGTDDTEGARLIALNMALNGTPREETERYLAENFNLSDAHSLLDEVYASVEG